jgi:hypothetical protein
MSATLCIPPLRPKKQPYTAGMLICTTANCAYCNTMALPDNSTCHRLTTVRHAPGYCVPEYHKLGTRNARRPAKKYGPMPQCNAIPYHTRKRCSCMLRKWCMSTSWILQKPCYPSDRAPLVLHEAPCCCDEVFSKHPIALHVSILQAVKEHNIPIQVAVESLFHWRPERVANK